MRPQSRGCMWRRGALRTEASCPIHTWPACHRRSARVSGATSWRTRLARASYWSPPTTRLMNSSALRRQGPSARATRTIWASSMRSMCSRRISGAASGTGSYGLARVDWRPRARDLCSYGSWTQTLRPASSMRRLEAPSSAGSASRYRRCAIHGGGLRLVGLASAAQRGELVAVLCHAAAAKLPSCPPVWAWPCLPEPQSLARDRPS